MIVGVGPGFGEALARHLAHERFRLVLICRNAAKLAGLVSELGAVTEVTAMGCDATDEAQVESSISRIVRDHGAPSLVVYALQAFGPGQVLEVSAAAFENSWRHNCYGAFLVSRTVAKPMVAAGLGGSIVFVGSTSSILGRGGHLNLAVGKFGQRALAQVLARELWPQGIHVAHAMIDADIQENQSAEHILSRPEDLAYSVLALHRQPKTAWTSELDLRPSNEQFWQHC